MVTGTRYDFGRDWNEVVNNWCLGLPLPMPAEETWEALGTLEQLWPERLGEVLTKGQRGNFVMAHLIDDGLTLAICQNLDGFEGVLNRIKNGEQAALSEMRFAAALVDLGYQAVLDTEHHGKHPDALIIADNQEIFIDVVTPEMSDHMKHLSAMGNTLVHKFLEKLSTTFTNKRLEIFALAPDLMSIYEDIDRFLDKPGNFETDKLYEIPGMALIKFHDGNAQVDIGQLIQAEPDPLLVMGFAATNQAGNSVVLRFSSADERLQRMLNDKSPQFSKEEANLFVIDLSHIPHGFKNWPALVRRRLQPERNRRFSGVLLLHRYLDIATGSFVLNTHLEEHPNPYKKLPASLLNDLMRLNQVVS